MQTYHFREEDSPRFNIRRASIVALVLLLILLFMAAKANPLQLSPEEIEEMAALQEMRQRDMVFRFIDTPEQVEENPEAEFLSDANRIKQSSPQLTETPKNQDPVSIGNSFELKQEPLPTVPSKPQQAQAQQQTTEKATNQKDSNTPKETPEEPEEPQDSTEEPDPLASETPLRENDPYTPKPYRKLSKNERKDLQKRAELEMVARDSSPSGALTERFDNPDGAAANQTGFSIDTAGHDLGPYLNILKQLVKSNWRIPSIARFEVRGFAVIDFKLHQDGRITDAYIYTQSGHEPLDTASLNAITGIFKAPPLPGHIKEPWIPIKFGFYYNMRPRY